MDRPRRLASTNEDHAAHDRPRDFTIRRGAHTYRIRTDGRSERELLRELRLIARPAARRHAA